MSLHDLECKYADGGKVSLVANALQAVKNAITHLESGDHAAAAATLRASPAAMQHPQVQAVAGMLRGGPSQARPAASQLRDVTNAETNQNIMPTFAGGGSTSKKEPVDIVAHLAQAMKTNPAAAPVLQAHAVALLRANLQAAQAIHAATGDPSGFGHYAKAASTLAGALGSGASGQDEAATSGMMSQILAGSGSLPQAVGPAAMQAARMAVPQQQPAAPAQAPVAIPPQNPGQPGPQ